MGNRRLGSYQVTDMSGRVLPECGLIQMQDLEAAVVACESMTGAWGIDPASCMKLCPTAEVSAEPVCVEHS